MECQHLGKRHPCEVGHKFKTMSTLIQVGKTAGCRSYHYGGTAFIAELLLIEGATLAERVNTFETISSIVQRSFVSGFWISLFRAAAGRLTTDAGNGLIDTTAGGALALGAPLTKRSGWRL